MIGNARVALAGGISMKECKGGPDDGTKSLRKRQTLVPPVKGHVFWSHKTSRKSFQTQANALMKTILDPHFLVHKSHHALLHHVSQMFLVHEYLMVFGSMNGFHSPLGYKRTATRKSTRL